MARDQLISYRPTNFELGPSSGLTGSLVRMKINANWVHVPCTCNLHPMSAFHAALWWTYSCIPVTRICCRYLKNSEISRIPSIKHVFPLRLASHASLGIGYPKGTYPSFVNTCLPNLVYVRQMVWLAGFYDPTTTIFGQWAHCTCPAHVTCTSGQHSIKRIDTTVKLY